MKLLYILSIILPLTVGGCDPENIDVLTDYDINGQWNLTHVGGGIDGRDLNFDPGIIIWTFNENTGMVSIKNNSGNGLSVFQSGTYSFLIEDIDGQRTLTIDGVLFDNFETSQDQIFISQQYADGISMTLTK